MKSNFTLCSWVLPSLEASGVQPSGFLLLGKHIEKSIFTYIIIVQVLSLSDGCSRNGLEGEPASWALGPRARWKKTAAHLILSKRAANESIPKRASPPRVTSSPERVQPTTDTKVSGRPPSPSPVWRPSEFPLSRTRDELWDST